MEDGQAMPELAARALGDVFQQLARIGDRGRDRCPPYSDRPPAMTRGEALELLRAAEHAIDYGRVHVDWLPKGDDDWALPRIGVSDRVRISGDERQQLYTVARARVEGADADMVELHGDDGSIVLANRRDLRTFDGGAQ